jgi:chromosome segregation ATPase
VVEKEQAFVFARLGAEQGRTRAAETRVQALEGHTVEENEALREADQALGQLKLELSAAKEDARKAISDAQALRAQVEGLGKSLTALSSQGDGEKQELMSQLVTQAQELSSVLGRVAGLEQQLANKEVQMADLEIEQKTLMAELESEKAIVRDAEAGAGALTSQVRRLEQSNQMYLAQVELVREQAKEEVRRRLESEVEQTARANQLVTELQVQQETSATELEQLQEDLALARESAGETQELRGYCASNLLTFTIS